MQSDRSTSDAHYYVGGNPVPQYQLSQGYIPARKHLYLDSNGRQVSQFCPDPNLTPQYYAGYPSQYQNYTSVHPSHQQPSQHSNISCDPQPVDNRSYIPLPNRKPQSVPFLSNLNCQNERVTPPNPNQSSSIPSNTTSSIAGSHIMGSPNSSLLVDVSTGTPSSLNLTSTNARPDGLGETVDHAQQQAPNATYSRDNSPENAQPPISDAPFPNPTLGPKRSKIVLTPNDIMQSFEKKTLRELRDLQQTHVRRTRQKENAWHNFQKRNSLAQKAFHNSPVEPLSADPTDDSNDGERAIFGKIFKSDKDLRAEVKKWAEGVQLKLKELSDSFRVEGFLVLAAQDHQKQLFFCGGSFLGDEFLHALTSDGDPMRKFAIWTAGTKKTNKRTRSATVCQAGTASNNGVENTIDTEDIPGEPPKKRQNYTSAEAYENRDVCEGLLAKNHNYISAELGKMYKLIQSNSRLQNKRGWPGTDTIFQLARFDRKLTIHPNTFGLSEELLINTPVKTLYIHKTWAVLRGLKNNLIKLIKHKYDELPPRTQVKRKPFASTTLPPAIEITEDSNPAIEITEDGNPTNQEDTEDEEEEEAYKEDTDDEDEEEDKEDDDDEWE
ncbi:hypothetical protein PCANC_09119 [Puccinia coronata f. sp. avenae]|uniref:Uncharacterized protein n=1 Tax=Puccinia coronata f. sp. avenae TaxID=200324 RepID=A0A2N5T1L6_9BASI|nr:hypothetical protein PCANC_09119 [Puccinia coronata f. sp. avenae]